MTDKFKQWFCIKTNEMSDICIQNKSICNPYIIKVFRFQRKTLLFLLGFFFPIIIIFFFLTVFVPWISRKRLDRFSWNFHTWYLMLKIYNTFFCFDDVTSGFEISTILWFLIGHFVQIVSPKRVKIDVWSFHGW